MTIEALLSGGLVLVTGKGGTGKTSISTSWAFRLAERGHRVLVIDLDFFKHVNDTLGHTVGDKLLQQVASRLKGVFREEDTIARLSGEAWIDFLRRHVGRDRSRGATLD